jgi:hypothetical protein
MRRSVKENTDKVCNQVLREEELLINKKVHNVMLALVIVYLSRMTYNKRRSTRGKETKKNFNRYQSPARIGS